MDIPTGNCDLQGKNPITANNIFVEYQWCLAIALQSHWSCGNYPQTRTIIFKCLIHYTNSLSLLHGYNISIHYQWEFQQLDCQPVPRPNCTWLPPLTDSSLPARQQVTQLQIRILCWLSWNTFGTNSHRLYSRRPWNGFHTVFTRDWPLWKGDREREIVGKGLNGRSWIELGTQQNLSQLHWELWNPCSPSVLPHSDRNWPLYICSGSVSALGQGGSLQLK